MNDVLFEIPLGDDTLKVMGNGISSSLCTIALSEMEAAVIHTLCRDKDALIPNAKLLADIRAVQPSHMQPMQSASYVVREVRVKLAAVTNNSVRIISKYGEGYRLSCP